MADREVGHGRQRARAQHLRQPLHAVLERRQHRAQRAQQRQVGRGEALVEPVGRLRLAQLLAAPLPHLEAQCCGRLVLSLQLLQQRLRRRPQLAVDTAQGHGVARVQQVAHAVEDTALLVAAEREERHGSRNRPDDALPQIVTTLRQVLPGAGDSRTYHRYVGYKGGQDGAGDRETSGEGRGKGGEHGRDPCITCLWLDAAKRALYAPSQQPKLNEHTFDT
eukprot:scaffold84286_cov63-Phaeocystis_antarctica.AAC.9